MKTIKHIFAVDSHTMGEPTRIIIGGIGPIPGATIVGKRQFLIDNFDHIRTALMHEPRGHCNMFGAIILEPTNPKADLGIVFMDCGGYLNMCGHGSIGVVTVALEMGILEQEAPITKVTLDTPGGLVYARAEIENGTVKSVTIQNVPSFIFRETLPIEVPRIGTIPIDIAFGGNFCALVAASDLGLELEPANMFKLIEMGSLILQSVNKIVVSHPTKSHIQTIDLVKIYGPTKSAKADEKNIVVFGHGQFDRSPCGTGTCARMAALFSKGKLKLGQEFINESIIGTTFSGRLIDETIVGNIKAVIPEITARAFITGIQQFVIDPADPLRYGFSI
ncbi:MAG: proline racemase family protein [Pseudomonadota bacterium]